MSRLIIYDIQNETLTAKNGIVNLYTLAYIENQPDIDYEKLKEERNQMIKERQKQMEELRKKKNKRAIKKQKKLEENVKKTNPTIETPVNEPVE